jgi:hypothetical protein
MPPEASARHPPKYEESHLVHHDALVLRNLATQRSLQHGISLEPAVGTVYADAQCSEIGVENSYVFIFLMGGL